jgi:hypothetical protein
MSQVNQRGPGETNETSEMSREETTAMARDEMIGMRPEGTAVQGLEHQTDMMIGELIGTEVIAIEDHEIMTRHAKTGTEMTTDETAVVIGQEKGVQQERGVEIVPELTETARGCRKKTDGYRKWRARSMSPFCLTDVTLVMLVHLVNNAPRDNSVHPPETAAASLHVSE